MKPLAPPLPPILGVHETVLYTSDVTAATAFYTTVLGLRSIGTSDADSAAFRMPTGDAVLLIFRLDYAQTEGRGVPPHGAAGAGHVAFRVPEGSLESWHSHMLAHGIPIELERSWPRGGRSLYIRDPAGNSVEFIEGSVWPE